MSLTAHIIRKDIFRLRWVLVLWVVVLTARMAMANLQSALDAANYYPFYLMARIFGSIFLPLLSIGLVMGVQNDDPVSDTDAFWITRPISGTRLLGAKSALLVLLCLIPPLTMTPWWIAHGFDRHQLCTAMFQAARWQAVLTLLTLPFAVIAHNTGRFVMIAMLAAAGSFGLILVARFADAGVSIPLSLEAIESRTWMMLAVWTTATVAITLVQFVARRTRISIVILVSALVAGCVISRWWSWSLLPTAASASEHTHDSTPTFQVRSSALLGSSVGMEYETFLHEDRSFAVATEVTHRLTWPNDSVSFVSKSSVDDQLAKACTAFALGMAKNPGMKSDFALPSDALRQRLLDEPPHYAATIVGETMQAEVVAALRPQFGEVSLDHGARLKISEVIPNDYPRGVVITVAESVPDLTSDAWRGLFDRPTSPPPKEFYFLVDREARRALLGAVAPVGESLTAGTITYHRKELIFSMGEDAFKRWAKTAMLIKIEVRDASPFSATAEEPMLKLKPNADGAPPHS